MKPRLVRAAVLVCGIALFACDDDSPATAPPVDAALMAKIDRGRYLVNHVAQCGFCHTPLFSDGSRDITHLLAGNDVFIPANPTGTALGSANLTPDTTGLVTYSDAQIVAAFRDGEKLDGSGTVQVHPWPIYKNMTDDDALAIAAYLRSIPPVANPIHARGADWGGRPAPLPIDFDAFPMPQGLTGADLESAMAGRYLVGAAGLCNNCHTPPVGGGANGPFDQTRFLAGGRAISKRALYGDAPNFPATIYGANLTPDPATGIGSWTLTDIRNVFRKGEDPTGACLCAPTHGSPAAPYGGLTDADVDSIGKFLLSIPPIENPTAKPNDCQAPGFCVP